MTETIEYLDIERDDLSQVWLNPVGGLGDIIMLARVLEQFHHATGRRLNVARRTAYTPMLATHPAVALYGNPPADAVLLTTDYWKRGEYGQPGFTATAIMMKMLGLKGDIPAECRLPAPVRDAATEQIAQSLRAMPRPRVIVSTASDSPRKVTSRKIWALIVNGLRERGITVVQTGVSPDEYIPGARSLVGATSPWQLPALVAEVDAVVSPDSFIVHAAAMAGVPAVTLFGPTPAAVYGYPGNCNLQAPLDGCPCATDCLGPHVPQNYPTDCPLEPSRKCLNLIDPRRVVDSVANIVNKIK